MKKVVVGMSGGVDSAVAAYLLKNEGYEVIGLFMRNWDSTINNDIEGMNITEDNICPQEKDYNDALEVCNKLNIPLKRIDFIKEYWDYVFKYFLDELNKGRTPNPDLLCNKYIKFDVFKKEAKKLGADYIATGHYARYIDGKLLKAKDLSKDQSYFLADVPKDNFKNVLFPVGDYDKTEIRKIALDNDLSVAKKKDSTGICFIGERNYQKFIASYLKPNPGDIIDVETKEVVGRHNGLMNYTIGQRRRVGLSGQDKKHYVCGKNVKDNILYVAFTNDLDDEYLLSDSCTIDNINLLCDKLPDKCSAKFRYRGEDYPISIKYLNDNEILVSYPEKVKSVTPGQACVLYDGDTCLGCGFINKVFKDEKELWYLS